MRLDHLLSKEHLNSSEFQNPDRRRSFFAGSSWVEHLTWCDGRFLLLVHCLRVVGTGWGLDVASARCWVLRDRKRWPFGVGGTVSSGPLAVSPSGVAGRGTARTLRTTQWTRASCSRFCRLHKMILKIISQFQTHTFGCGSSFDSNSCDLSSL